MSWWQGCTQMAGSCCSAWPLPSPKPADRLDLHGRSIVRSYAALCWACLRVRVTSRLSRSRSEITVCQVGSPFGNPVPLAGHQAADGPAHPALGGGGIARAGSTGVQASADTRVPRQSDGHGGCPGRRAPISRLKVAPETPSPRSASCCGLTHSSCLKSPRFMRSTA